MALWHTVQTESGPTKLTFPSAFRLRSGANAFELRHAVKGGGNGVVFEAHHYSGGQFQDVCAVKMLRKLDRQRVDRFDNEVRVMAELDHPRVSRLIGAGQYAADGIAVPWLAMNLGRENLRERVLPIGDGVALDPRPFAPAELAKVGTQLCQAVAHLHELGFVHRDIKPDNFVMKGDGSGVVMIDFGLAKRVNEDVSERPMDQFTRALEFVGPTFFASPELIAYSRDKTQEVGPRSDLFMLGKVLWFLATGVVLAGVPSRRQDPTGGGLHALVLALLAEDPNDRPSSASEIERELRSF